MAGRENKRFMLKSIGKCDMEIFRDFFFFFGDRMSLPLKTKPCYLKLDKCLGNIPFS